METVMSATQLVWSIVMASAVLTADQRLTLIKRSHVWQHTDVASMDLKAGPRVKGAFAPGETIRCDYVKEKFGGNTPKFGCALTPDDHLKVRYGRDNGEVYASVATTRLLWALGFGADAVYPVHVVCRGCPPEIKDDKPPANGETYFDVAAVERKFPGHDLEAKGVEPGWSWPELDLVDEQTGATRPERDALKLLAAMLQHTDSKAEQQRLVCLARGDASKDNPAACAEPFMLIHDVGLTFGRANLLNRGPLGSVNLKRWEGANVWKDAKTCVALLTPSQTGTLDHPLISEAGRRFLADLLGQLTDDQVRDMFMVARFGERWLPDGVGGSPIPLWLEAFKHKRQEIASATCPT
jgi:hypothetical protein